MEVQNIFHLEQQFAVHDAYYIFLFNDLKIFYLLHCPNLIRQFNLKRTGHVTLCVFLYIDALRNGGGDIWEIFQNVGVSITRSVLQNFRFSAKLQFRKVCVC